MIPDPTGITAALLLLALPGVGLAGRALGRVVFHADLWLARLTAPGFAVAGWLLAIHIAGLLTGSFQAGLWIGTLVVSAIGLALHLGRFVERPAVGWIPGRAMWIGTAAAVAAIAPVALGWAFHDELWLTGHMSITAAIHNGPYPPANLNFPSLGLRYHYGFDLLNAAVTSILRLPIDTGIDLLTLLCQGWLFALLWAAGDRMLGQGRGWVTALLVSLAGGFTFACGLVADGAVPSLLGACTTGPIFVNPPLVSYFFQHPWTLGLPLALTLGLAFAQDTTRPPVRYPAIALLLLALSLCQAVLFAGLGAAIVAAEAWDGRRIDVRRGGLMLATSLGVLFVASRLGGFFAPWPAPANTGLGLRAGIAGSPGMTLLWHVASFGWVLPAGLYGLARAPRGRTRTLAAALVIGSLVIINLVEYRQSWDIAKFGTVALVVLAGAASLPVARMIAAKRWAGAVASCAALTMGGVSFVLILTLRLPGIPAHMRGAPTPLGPQDVAAVNWLREHMEAGDVVYRSPPFAMGWAQWGGLPQAHLDRMAHDLGFPPDLIARRESVLSVLPETPATFLEQHIRWLVIGPGDEILGQRAGEWIRNGTAAERDRFGDLTIIELSGAAAAR